ncbi:DUF4381 family protein [Candidatus Dependentiae bacterium]|nr:MAG: DUF4381 family protein [Candidatus Dependentiae bacterium]
MEKINKLELYDIYSTWHVPFWQTTWFYLTIIALTVLVVGSIVAWLVIQYKERNKPTKTAWQIALGQLHTLQKNTYSSKAAGKQCYFSITSILKQYLHAQYQLRTIGKTDEELIRYLKQSTLLTQSVLKNLQDICSGCLYIKFANQEAVQKQISEHLAMSVQIVQDTKPNDRQHTK